MPTFRFRGFQTGALVNLSATQGANTASGSVATWAQTAATPITLSLAANRISGTAPMGVTFTATATSPAARVERPFNDMEYVWSFDNPGSYSALDNDPIWGADQNTAYGPATAHVFSTPGTYVVTCTAYDGENPPRSETITIEVDDPADIYAGSKTAVVSLVSNFSGAPAGAQQFNSIGAAQSVMRGDQDYRILLRRGETYTGTQVDIDEGSGSGKRILLGNFGNTNDPKPLIDFSGTTGNYGIRFDVDNGVANELAVNGIDVLGPYDPTATGQGANSAGGGVEFRAKSLQAYKTIWGCHFKNSGNEVIDISTGNDMQNVYVGNCFFDGWRNYGALISTGGNIAFIGSKIKQPSGTRNAAGKNNDFPDHGPFRMSNPTGPAFFINCDLASYNDWSTGSNYSMQPTVRWNAGSGPEAPEAILVIDRVRSEGGPIQTVVQSGSSDTRVNVRCVVDRFHMVGSSHQSINLIHGGVTFRNGILVIPNVRAGGSIGIRNDGIIRDQTAGNGRRSEMYSCMIADLRNNTNAQTRAQTSGTFDFVLPIAVQSQNYMDQNIGYCPLRSGAFGYTADDPIDATPSDWSPTYAGEIKDNAPGPTTTPYGTEVTASFAPQTGSAAIGTATGKVSILDFNGNLRSDVLAGLARSTPSKGPFEPNLES